MNSNQIKILAIIFMIVEHSSTIFAELFNYPSLNFILHYGGRVVFPIFVFLVVEGFFKTSSRENYIKRIFTWAIVMSLGSFVLVYILSILLSVDIHTFFISNVGLFQILAPIGHNIFLSLGVGLLLLYFIEKAKKTAGINKILNYIIILILCPLSLLTESSIHVVPLFLIFYFFYNQKKRLSIAYTLFSLFFLINGLLNIKYFWSFEYQWMMIFALPIFLLYDGERGSTKMKYFFYIIYPLHLWVFFFIEKFVLHLTH